MLTPGVYIVGVGPGDPELLTLKGLKIIQQADAIFYADSLIPPGILALASPAAEIIPTSSLTLEEILPLMVERVEAGKAVARLHSGDLTLYSTVQEQVRELRSANIPCQLIPGIGVFQAAAAELQVELTVPELVQTIILTRAQGRASAMPSTEDLASLAAHRASLCLYLAAKQVQKAEAALLQHYPAATTVAICWRIGWPEQQIWQVPLTEMAATTALQGLERTTLYIISPALNGVGGRSRLYTPSHSHLFRSNTNTGNSTV
jgi:precorrin-4/cobalt-precorrin-4 C11-methyltransferase